MKALKMSPVLHQISLEAIPLPDDVLDDVGIMDVQFTFGMHHGGHVFTADELEAVGKWFLRAATRARRKKVSPGTTAVEVLDEIRSRVNGPKKAGG